MYLSLLFVPSVIVKNLSKKTKQDSGHFNVAAQGVFAAPRIMGPVAFTTLAVTTVTRAVSKSVGVNA